MLGHFSSNFVNESYNVRNVRNVRVGATACSRRITKAMF